jgi:hypothetical protein
MSTCHAAKSEASRPLIDPCVDSDLHQKLTIAAMSGAYVQQAIEFDVPHVVKSYVVKRTSDSVREELGMEEDDELPLTEWLKDQRAILRDAFELAAFRRNAGVLCVVFTDEIAEELEALGVPVGTWEDYLVPVAFADLA